MGTALCQLVGCVATPIPQQLGLTSVGSDLDGGDAGSLNGSKITAPASGAVVTAISVYVGPVDTLVANRSYQVAIYTDEGGQPGALVASSGTGRLVANSWNTLPIAATLVAGADYWLEFATNGRTAAVNNLFYQPGPCCVTGGYSIAPVPFGTWPATFPPVNMTGQLFSIYATIVPR